MRSTVAVAATAVTAVLTLTAAQCGGPAPSDTMPQDCKTNPTTSRLAVTQPGPKRVKVKQLKLDIETCLHGTTLWALAAMNGSKHYAIIGRIASQPGYSSFAWHPKVTVPTTSGNYVDYAFYLAGPTCSVTLDTHRTVTIEDLTSYSYCQSPYPKRVLLNKG